MIFSVVLLCRSLKGKSDYLKLKLFKSATIFQSVRCKSILNRRTIFALSTPPGMSAIAVVRISGPNAIEVLYKMGKLKKPPDARKALLCKLNDPETDELLDKALTLWFPSPNSFTGEDLCELHIHGGTAVIKSVLNALQKLPHFCFAEPGEFTKRAFMSGKLDLTEVEALADLLHAETEGQQKQALRQMEGSLYKLYNEWSGRLKQCLANLEAYIDFSEDQLLDNSIFTSVRQELGVLKKEITIHLSDKRKGEKLRSGVNTVLVGRPNVGKSSFLNNLCKRDIAIVSSTAGTTRDVIESSLNIGGYLVNICDTAGIRETCNSVEGEGVRRAIERSSKADLLVFIIEAKKALELLESYCGSKENLMKYLLNIELGNSFTENISSFLETINPQDTCSVKQEYSNIILLLNKLDLLCKEDLQKVLSLEDTNSSVCAISCVTGKGMEKFVNLFSDRIKDICCIHSGEEPAITQQRHRNHVQNCLHYILEYEETLDLDVAIAADNLRNAMNELGKITGKIRIDDILDIVFQSFCIGK